MYRCRPHAQALDRAGLPPVGASSVAQLDESLAAADPKLTTEQRTRLDTTR